MYEQREFLWNLYQTINSWIAHADAKAGTILASSGLLIGFILTNINSILIILKSNGYWLFFSLLSFLSLITAIIFAFYSILPSLKVGEPKSLIYFNHISQHSCLDFMKMYEQTNDDPNLLSVELIHQVWANSKVATKKYRNICRATYGIIISTFLGLIPVIGYVINKL